MQCAFLQGSATQVADNVLANPVPELREQMKLKEDEVVRLRKAVYGL